MSIGWGIVGIGNHVERFMAPAIQKAANAGLVAVCSRSLEKAQDFAKRYGAKRAYDSLDAMLNAPEVEVVYVATPNNMHAQNTIQAARAGKHVLCEKPMALTEADCERMIEACAKNKVKLAVDFQNRYHPAHLCARRLIQTGEIGEIVLAKAQYSTGSSGSMKGWRNDPGIAGAGALVGLGVHPIDLLRFLLDSEIEEVTAMVESVESTLDDMVYVLLKFQSGTRGVVVSGRLVPRSDNDAVLYGKKARITCKGTVGMPLHGELIVEGDTLNVVQNFPTEDVIPGNYIRVVEAFSRCVETGTESDIPGTNGLQMVKITNAILESGRSGKAVKIL